MKLHQRRRVASARLKHQGKEPLSNLGTNPPHSPSAVAVALPSAQVSSLGMIFWTSSASPPSALHRHLQLLLSLISCLLQLGLHHCLCSQSLWTYICIAALRQSLDPFWTQVLSWRSLGYQFESLFLLLPLQLLNQLPKSAKVLLQLALSTFVH